MLRTDLSPAYTQLRTTFLRQYPAAAAEWAKPREIRRGTS